MDLVDTLKARAVDLRFRDIKKVGIANVGPIQGFFDWRVAAEIVSLRAQLANARKALGEARDSICTGFNTVDAIAAIDAALTSAYRKDE